MLTPPSGREYSSAQQLPGGVGVSLLTLGTGCQSRASGSNR